jgi:hypothetical protein
VYLGSIRLRALAALAMAVALAGCTDMGIDSSAGWFSKPIDALGRKAGYTYSDLQEARLNKPITANDLIDANGGCPLASGQPQAAPASGDQAASPGAPVPGEQLGEGVGLGMSECEVVGRAGPPNSVQLGTNPNGDRTAVLSYQSGPRPGIYHFERGRLMQLDRVDVPEPPPQTAKKKPAKPKKQAASNSAT